MRKFLLFTLLALLGVSASYAQVTTSSISGSVRDAKGEALIGATLKAVHKPTGTVYGVSTNVEGRFAVPNMRAGGPYTIEVSYIGYQSRGYEGIILKLGEPFVLNAVLSNSGTNLTEVVVSAKSSVLNTDKTGAGTNVGLQQINRVPTITRSLSDATKLTPQANGNGFAGRDGRYNNVQLDGANFNNGFGLSSDLLPGGNTAPVSLEAIEEMQVNIAPYDVRQSGFTGAGINAITRSGTNKFAGSAYTFFRNQGLRGTKIGDFKLNNPDNSANTYGVRIGGPIIENKLFFFANYEHEKETFPGVNYIASRPGLAGSNVSRTTADDLERVRKHLIETYQYDPGAYENYANEFMNKGDRFLVRLDYNINDKNKLTFRYNYSKGTSDQIVNGNSGPNPRSTAQRISNQSLVFANSNYSFLNKVSSVTGEWNSVINSNLSNQLLATYTKTQTTRSYPGSRFPFVDIFDGDNNYMSFGTELFSGDNDLKNNSVSIVNNLTYLLGNNTITGGISYEYIDYGNLYQRMSTSYYRYKSLNDFINNASPSLYGITYVFPGQDPYVKIKFGLGGAYIQDKLAVSDNLDVTFGVRAEMPFYLNDLTANPSIDNLELLDRDGKPTRYSSSSWPKSKVMLSPRAGFNFDVNGDRSLTLRGGTGLFSGRLPFVWLTNMPGGSGVIQNTLEPVPTKSTDKELDAVYKQFYQNLKFNTDPMHWVNNGPEKIFIKGPAQGAPGSIALVHKEFKMPKVWRTSVGADYSIPNSPFVLSGDFLYTKDVNGIYQFNANRRPATKKLNYSGDNRDFFDGNYKYSDKTGDVTAILSNTDKGYSMSATLGLSVPSFKGFSGSVYYTYTQAEDISGNPGSAAGSAWSNNYSINDPNEQLLGYSQFAVPHRVMANLSFKKEYLKNLATTVSLFYEGTNPGRFAYTTGGDINGDRVSADLLYIPADASELKFVAIADKDKDGKPQTPFTPEEQLAAYQQIVNNTQALKDAKGGYIRRNAGLLPWLNRFDFRLLQDVFTNIGPQRHSLQFSFDVQNVGNLFNNTWGVSQMLNGSSGYNYALLDVVSVSKEGVPSFNMTRIKENGKTILPTTPFRKSETLSNTWRMQFGVRYLF